MGSDMVIAMKEASASGTTLFGLNRHAATAQRHRLHRCPARHCDVGEMIKMTSLQMPQARQVAAVLGVQPIGAWGLAHGVNEHRVAIGVTEWESRLPAEGPALTGPELVRLGLERSRNALNAVEVLTDLIDRHGQGSTDGETGRHSDNILLIADRDEAYVLEASGRHWALLECRLTRVVTDTAMIRQDWRRLAPGMADHVIGQGWWVDDGSKIDFVRCLATDSDQARAAQRRWGRASLALAQQHGAIDLHFLRRMLSDHYDQNADLISDGGRSALATSFLADLHHSEVPLIAWVAFGPPRVSLAFPLFLIGELPAAWVGGHPEMPTIEDRTRDMARLAQEKAEAASNVTYALERLQTRFDQDAEEFIARAHDYVLQGNPGPLAQMATQMMHQHVEAFEKEYRHLFNIADRPAAPVRESEELLFFA
jgi:secernin